MGTPVTVRNFVALTCVACISISVLKTSFATKNNTLEHVNSDLPSKTPVIAGEEHKFHQSGFGGIHNINHPTGAMARRRMSEANVIIPKSAVENAIPSLSRENIENLHGHYVHDEHRSPFASFLYDRPKEDLEEEQKDYVERMEKIREKWGAWDFNDEHPEIRPIANFDETPYKDMKNDAFPPKSWQMDQTYVTDFIAEARKLVNRVREGIYAEYGHATEDMSCELDIKLRNELFKIHITDEAKHPGEHKDHGLAYINKKGLDMYARKLLHSMITNDEFYYVMGGHSAAAGHGNNFHQTYLMEFANIMEPVLHKLGVRLIARNLAMGGYGTLHFSLGAATLYGETDVMMWDSSMTEKSHEDQDLFHKQVLLGGERVPVLLGGAVNNLEVETGGNLWYGELFEGHSGVPLTTGIDQAEKLPWAVQNFVCEKTVADLCDRGLLDECWVPRSDIEPPMEQKPHVGGKAKWHPGWREHKYNARKQTMLMLKALDTALDMWEDGIKTDDFPLKESYWHVGEIYDTTHSKLYTYLNNEGFNTTACEKKFGHTFGLDRACRMSLKGMGEMTPRNRGQHNSIQAHLKAAPNGYKPSYEEDELYEGIDVLPPVWKVPEGEVDVHAIAIASTYAAPELDHSWVDNEDKNLEEAVNSRRMLRKSATERISLTNNVADDIAKGVTGPDERNLVKNSDSVVPGQGWIILEYGKTSGYCDGSPVSSCSRSRENDCLMYGHNDGRQSLAGNGLSGFLVFTVPEVKEGLIFAKFEWWHPRGTEIARTKDWTEVDNGMTSGGDERSLKAKVIEWPQDFELDIAVNGKIIKTYNYDELKPFAAEVAYNQAFFPIVDDKDLVTRDKPEPIEVGLRIRSESNPRDASFSISHIYYA